MDGPPILGVHGVAPIPTYRSTSWQHGAAQEWFTNISKHGDRLPTENLMSVEKRRGGGKKKKKKRQRRRRAPKVEWQETAPPMANVEKFLGMKVGTRATCQSCCSPTTSGDVPDIPLHPGCETCGCPACPEVNAEKDGQAAGGGACYIVTSFYTQV
jgi:hypothetical protein